MEKLVTIDAIEQRIFLIRGQKVMLSPHLADLYGVAPKVLIQAVKRNIERFPEDFMFQLTKEEAKFLRSQIVTLQSSGHFKYLPYAFTEQGIAMLSSALNSKRAIQVNIAIMRAFVRLRRIIASHKELAEKLKELEHKVNMHDKDIIMIFQAINKLMQPEEPKRAIGFQK
ncbi:MAG: ORF6N domain-containing protein [Candidatus Omnitrophota bacterium]